MRLLEGFLTSLRFCCAANVVTASEAREPDVYRDCSNRLLGGAPGRVVVVRFSLAQAGVYVTWVPQGVIRRLLARSASQPRPAGYTTRRSSTEVLLRMPDQRSRASAKWRRKAGKKSG